MNSGQRDENNAKTVTAEVVAEAATEGVKNVDGAFEVLQEVAEVVGRLLEGALAAEALAGDGDEAKAEAALLAAVARADAAGVALPLVQALLDRTWERLNTGHWSTVSLARRRLYALASLHKVRLLMVERSAAATGEVDGVATALRAALSAADRGLLLGAPLPLAGGGQGDGADGGCALAATAAALSRALARLRPAPLRGATKQRENLFSNLTTSVAPPSGCVSSRTVPTLHQPSLQRFANDHFTPRLPVHLAGAANHWPAKHRWCSLEYLCHIAGARTVPVELGAHYVDPNWAQRLMTLETFVKQHVESQNQDLTAEDNNPNNIELGYLAQHPLFDQVPELRGDICIPEYCCLSDEPDGPLDPDINAWFGPAGTLSPLHFDPKHNLLTQVVGSKRVLLYAPEESSALYPHEGTLLNNTAQVDPEKPDYESFPAFRNAGAWECTLQPGDMLYIPPRWWHHVRSLSISFSVSFWWQ